MKIIYSCILALLLLFASCATTTGFYYGVDAKTPKEQTARLLLGIGVTLKDADGNQLNYGPGPIDIVVRPGLLKATVSTDYYFDLGRLKPMRPKHDYNPTPNGQADVSEILEFAVSLVTTKDIEMDPETVEFEPQAGETWVVGREFSRSILEMPSTLEPVSFTSTQTWDQKKSQSKLVARKMVLLPNRLADSKFVLKPFTGHMPPVFSPDSRFLAYSAGKDVVLVDFNAGAAVKTVRISSSDVVWGGFIDNDTCWFIDTEGKLYKFSISQRKVLSSEGIAGKTVKPTKAVGTSAGTFLQTGKDLIAIDPKTPASAGVWVGTNPILDWCASESGKVAVLTSTELILLGPDLKELARRPYAKGEIAFMDWKSVRGMSFSPDGTTLAFLDQFSRIWTLRTDSWMDFPSDWWKTIGNSYWLPMEAQNLAWSADSQGLFSFSTNYFQDTLAVYQFDLPSSGGNKLYGGPSGATTIYKAPATLTLPKQSFGTVSKDGKKLAFLISGATPGIYGVGFFYANPTAK